MFYNVLYWRFTCWIVGSYLCVFIKFKKISNLRGENNLESKIKILERTNVYTDRKKLMLFDTEENIVRENTFYRINKR